MLRVVSIKCESLRVVLFNFACCKRTVFTKMSKRSSNDEVRGYNFGTKVTKNDSHVQNKRHNVESEEQTSFQDKSERCIQYLKTPVKSENDKKEYRVLRLENGLTALLISDVPHVVLPSEEDLSLESGAESESESESDSGDSKIDEAHSGGSSDEAVDRAEHKKTPKQEEKLAALGLCIGVGSFSDPWELPGMAHFLEHMVFMGSEKFPKENDFDSFIKKHGGSDNAATECEHTTFYFECQEKHLAIAMDKFAQFFISPLMKREAMTREREAIESEFQMSLSSHYGRTQQLLSSLARTNHPARKFTWGNLKTLRDNIADDVLYNAVHEFRKKHYSAHRMTLAVQARLPLSMLEEWVYSCFNPVPSNSLPPDDFQPFSGQSFNTPEFTRLYRIDPIKDICQVELTWALPSQVHMYRSKPHEYLGVIIGHEGKGSLLSFLRKNVWALDIYTGDSDHGCEHNSMHTLFSITLILTDAGYKNLSKVIESVFGYIQLLQSIGPCERIFQELKTIEETSFRFAEEISAADYVETLAENMQFYPPEDYICGPILYSEYNPQAIQECLDLLRPDNVNIIVSTKNTNIVFDKVEPWFGTKYTVSDIPPEWLAAWRTQKPDPSFSLPDPNIYVTKEFGLKTHKEPVPAYPIRIQKNELSEVWFRPDTKFKLPLAYLHFFFISPLPLASPLNLAMLDLYVSILKQLLIEELYPAEEAELHSYMHCADRGFALIVSGYNEKLHLLLETVTKHVACFGENLTESLFDAMKEEQIKFYYNSFLKPGKLSKDLRFSVILQTHWSAVDKHTAIGNVTMDKMKTFAKHFWEHLYIQSLVQGNYTEREALDACAVVIQNLKCGPLLPNTLPQIRVCQVPVGSHYCCVKSYNIHDSNSVVTNYYQSGLATIRNLCIIELLMMMMDEPVFDRLRTKEQLGYNVFCMLRDTFGIAGFSITVHAQENKHRTGYVDERIEAFLRAFSKILKRMPEKEIEGIRQSAIKLKQCTDLHLKEEVSRNWDEILTMEYVFDRLEKEVQCIESIKSQEIKKWFEDHVECGNKSNIRKLSCQVVGTTENVDNEEKVGSEEKEKGRTTRCAVKSCQYLLKDVKDAGPGNVSYGSKGEYPLHILHTCNSQKHTWITDIEGFKQGLFVYPVNKIVPQPVKDSKSKVTPNV